jgi:hypothetical protein
MPCLISSWQRKLWEIAIITWHGHSEKKPVICNGLLVATCLYVLVHERWQKRGWLFLFCSLYCSRNDNYLLTWKTRELHRWFYTFTVIKKSIHFNKSIFCTEIDSKIYHFTRFKFHVCKCTVKLIEMKGTTPRCILKHIFFKSWTNYAHSKKVKQRETVVKIGFEKGTSVIMYKTYNIIHCTFTVCVFKYLSTKMNIR